MASQFAAVGGVVLLALVSVGIVFVLGMRAKAPIVQGAVVWLTRVVFNPRQMRTAGTPGAYAAIIRHRGRTSGRPFETPVGVVSTDDAFLVTLPYGRSNWARNVLAAGSAVLVHEGETFDVTAPEIIPLTTVETALSAGDQRMARLFRVTEVLRLQRADPGTQAPSRRPTRK
jgi:deazaflavin-dependent oxidoreductase (nitroreductase family)